MVRWWMDPRRLNTWLEIVGLAGALLVKLAPLLPPGLATDVVSLILAFAGGVGVRAAGTEYKEVAEAKAEAKVLTRVVASMQPPPPYQSKAVVFDNVPPSSAPPPPKA